MSDLHRLYPTGRKFCTRCGGWRHLHEFCATSRDENGDAVYLTSRCKTCDRLLARERGGHTPQRIGYCKYGHRLTPENTVREHRGHRRCRRCLREYYRFYENGRRRRQGIAPRNFRRRRHDSDIPELPIGPFRGWLREKGADCGSVEELARMVEMHPRSVRRLLSDNESVALDTVDRALMAVGEIERLNDLYPLEDD